MINQFLAASPATALVAGCTLVVLIVASTIVSTTAVRSARLEDVPRIAATICRALRRR